MPQAVKVEEYVPFTIIVGTITVIPSGSIDALVAVATIAGTASLIGSISKIAVVVTIVGTRSRCILSVPIAVCVTMSIREF